MLPLAHRPDRAEESRFFEYQVNVLVDNAGRSGAPVICEDAPTYRNLFGTIERWVDPTGRTGTNFTRIIARLLSKRTAASWCSISKTRSSSPGSGKRSNARSRPAA